MKRVKQINESKKLIFEGFMRLLNKFDFENITMSEIANEAGVTRMTLYRHFREKEDIFLYAFEQSFEQALLLIEEKDNPEIMDLLVFRFRLLKESPYTRILSDYNKLNKLFQTVGKSFSHCFSSLIPQFEDEYVKSFIAGGIDAMTELWINQGMKESPEDMALKTLSLLNIFNDYKV